ncbi:MAG: ribosomal-processing cysteine protease Prp [Lachnospiraceae bacterium]|nr:ribosomal-processing cysteine protease Prp [Lachnospiraceae bacterium]
MITIKTERKPGRFYVKLSGHAGYAPPGENDIVCAAISMIFYTFINTIETWKKKNSIEIAYEDKEGKAWVSVTYREDDKKVQGSVEMLVTGFLMLKEKYPQNINFF